MSQGNIALAVVGTVSGLQNNQAANVAFAAISTKFSGGSAPSATGQPFAFQDWIDTSGALKKRRDSGNSVWIDESFYDRAWGGLLDYSDAVLNLDLTFTASGNALTAHIKSEATGNNPTAGDPVIVAFRSSTANSGGHGLVSVVSAANVTLSNGSTLAATNAVAHTKYWYGINNAGNLEVAVSASYLGESGIMTTVAEGGGGAADSGTVVYSTTARSAVPFRLLARTVDLQAVAGVYGNTPTQEQQAPFTSPITISGVGQDVEARNTAADIITMTAFRLTLHEESTGQAIVLRNVSVTANMAIAGAGGLDTGGETGSTWYYGHVIYNPTLGAVSGLASLSTTTPVMPSGYTYRAWITAARNDPSSNFFDYEQKGNDWHFENAQNVLTDGAAVSETAITITGVVPPGALEFTIIGRSQGATADAGGIIDMATSFRVTTGVDARILRQLFNQALTPTTGTTRLPMGEFRFPNISQTLLYRHVLTTGTNPVVTVDVVGFKLPVCGE